MGGLSSSHRCSIGSSCKTDHTVVNVVKVAPPSLEAAQKVLLRNAWQGLERDIAKVGVITFIGLFKTHPHVQDFFLPFTGLSKTDMEYSSTLRAHALRFMATVEKCMHRLDDTDRMRSVLETLGGRHAGYNAKVEYVDLLGTQFVLAVKEHTPDWSRELEDAWLSLVRIITFYVKHGWIEKQDNFPPAKESLKRDRAISPIVKKDNSQRSYIKSCKNSH